MQKIPTLFVRQDYTQDRRLVSATVTPGLEGVLDARSGLWTPTRKYNGIAAKLDDAGRWWIRKTVKPEHRVPEGYVKTMDHPVIPGQSHGWVPVGNSPQYNAFMDAVAGDLMEDCKPGTYELIGTTIHNNPERVRGHKLISHADAPAVDLPPLLHDYNSLQHYFLRKLRPAGVEGIVWHNADGRMAKLKVSDFAV